MTNTAPDDWRYQDDATIATAIAVLEARADAERRALKKSGRGRHG